MTWVALDTPTGECYVDIAHVIGIGPPMWNQKGKGTTETRSVMMTYGYLLVLNSERNIATLRDMDSSIAIAVPPDAHEQHAPLPAPKVKKAKADKPTESPAPRGKKGPSNG